MKVLIVGAGFAGAVYARTLSEAGLRVQVIDKRSHIAGNAYDFVDANGVRVHAYGPHLFHTKSQRVLDWIKKFSEFVSYSHKVMALLPTGRFAPLPINLDTVNLVFGTSYKTAEEIKRHLAVASIRIDVPANAAEYLYSKIGKDLTDLFFRPYTRKMWQLDLEEMAESVVRRIPLRLTRTNTYFADDEIQVMPRYGYARMFEKIFEHPNIRVHLSTEFETPMLRDYDFCFNAMPIDEYYGFRLGELPYRSIRFHARTEAAADTPSWAVTNFTDDGLFTRETTWDVLPHHRIADTGRRTITKEQPCDYRENAMERYYPVKTSDGRFHNLYQEYKALATKESILQFIGRCGTYQYLDMDQVIAQSLTGAEQWLATHSIKVANPIKEHLVQ